MPFRFLPDVALADVAFEVTSTSVSGLFKDAAAALTEVMVDRQTLARRKTSTLRLEAEDLDRLLYDFLTDLIIRKDVDLFLVKDAEVRVERSGRRLEAKLAGEKINRLKHGLRNDVKAVTMHMFGVRREGRGWKATVVLDI
ncbi:MAG: archease [Nitrososphaerales archaeon]|nr:archease [Nitrososphaerales archaeon]